MTLSSLEQGAPSGASAPEFIRNNSIGARRSKLPGLTMDEAERAYRDDLYDLRAGLLFTRKAVQTGAAQWLATATSVNQSIPDYQDLPAGQANNNAVIADKGWWSAVTAVYNLTVDPTRATNVLSSFNRDNQQVVLTGSSTTGDTLEVVGSWTPYQGMWDLFPTSQTGATSHILIEPVIVDLPFITTDGSGGGHVSTDFVDSPLIPKLPLPSASGATRSNVYDKTAINWVGGTGVSSSNRASLRESVPVMALKSTSAIRAFRPGRQWYATTAAERGAQQTVPATSHPLPVLAAAPAKFIAGRFALVRVASVQADRGGSVLMAGRLLIACLVSYNTTTQPLIQSTSTSSLNAIDFYRLNNDPDLFEGMKVWQ